MFREWVAQALTAPRAASPDSITRAADFILPLATPVNTTEKTEETPKVLLPERKSAPAGKPAASKSQSREEYSYRPAKPASVQEQPKTYLRKKGIKHLTPFRTWIGAVAVLLFFASSISAIVLTTMMLLNGERGWQIICLCFGPWILALILYLAVALPRKCSVCRAPLFSFKNTTATRRPTTFRCSVMYSRQLCIYSSSTGSAVRPAARPSSWAVNPPQRTAGIKRPRKTGANCRKEGEAYRFIRKPSPPSECSTEAFSMALVCNSGNLANGFPNIRMPYFLPYPLSRLQK